MVTNGLATLNHYFPNVCPGLDIYPLDTVCLDNTTHCLFYNKGKTKTCNDYCGVYKQ